MSMANPGKDGSYVFSTPEGWFAPDLKNHCFLMDYSPPRPHAVFFALRQEARSWKIWAIWLAGTAGIALGLLPGARLVLVLSLTVLLTWLFFFLKAVMPMRSGPMLTGVVETLERHPFGSGYSTATARQSNGRTFPVVLFMSESELLEREGPIEVLFLHAPRSEYSPVFGIRGIPRATACSDDSTEFRAAPGSGRGGD
jgi:hypothetical protein